MQESTWTGQNTLSEMLERIRATARVELVYGDETRLVPILDWTRIITTGLTAFGVWMVFRTIFRRR